jgi:hypothetical protein
MKQYQDIQTEVCSELGNLFGVKIDQAIEIEAEAARICSMLSRDGPVLHGTAMVQSVAMLAIALSHLRFKGFDISVVETTKQNAAPFVNGNN